MDWTAEETREPAPEPLSPLQYDYRPKWTIIVLSALFFGACALVLGAKANGNDRGLIINRIIELSAVGATVFYWVLAVLSVGFVVIAGIMAIVRLTVHQRITLAEIFITMPRSRWSSEEIIVPFSEIVELTASEVSGQRFFKIVYSGGKFTLTASMLPRNEDFDEICAAVSEGVKVAGMNAKSGRELRPAPFPPLESSLRPPGTSRKQAKK